MMIKDRSKLTDEQWDLKRKYDEAFDKVFLREDFRFHATSILKRCPKGLDLDTCFDNVTEEMVIVCRCKIYGYEYSSFEHVCGDYYCEEMATRQMLDICLTYLQEKNPVLYDEIKELKKDYD